MLVDSADNMDCSQNPYDVYYFGYYAKPTLCPSRHAFPSAVSKMDYIVSCFERLGFRTLLISGSPVARGKQEGEARLPLSRNTDCMLLRSPGRRCKLSLPVQKVLGKACTLFGLVRHVPRDATLVVYHSLAYSTIIRLAKKLRGFKLVLEVEELYSDVTGKVADLKRERRAFVAADAFIFSTNMLADRVELGERPYVVCSGIYQPTKIVAEKRDDGIIHVVYAGTLDPRKGGAAAAAAAGALLDAGYAMHILGRGNEFEVAEIEDAVNKANACSRGCKITYDGLILGREFNEFVQSCHIGLSPQNPASDFNASSFPSKVFMYLSNGLKVVSVDLPVFEGDLRKALTLCHTNASEDLARAIHAAAVRGEDSAIDLLERLDKGFMEDLSRLFALMRDGGAR